jgi:DNA invertase Pin-like site-specific DNA recombinase
MNTQYISLVRVSTKTQSDSGLGLEAQRQSIAKFIGDQGDLIQEFLEVESGKKKDRKILDQAIATCKKRKATLIVARLDRLSRRVHLISGLIESGIKFVVVENPSATPLTLNILAAVAQEEARLISVRTKAGLEQAKKRGVVLGANGENLAKANKAAADSFAQSLKPILMKLLQSDIKKSFGSFAKALNKRRIKTENGNLFQPTQVRRVMLRLGLTF